MSVHLRPSSGAGNIIGGGGMVALVYWVIYLRPHTEPTERPG